MMKKIDLSGTWQMDGSDTITLPGTLSYWKKGTPSDAREIKNLTDPYAFEGTVRFSRRVELESLGEHLYLNMERTRISRVYVDGVYVGTQDSFVAPHVYELTAYVKSRTFTLDIEVQNTDYKTGGGHMTSPDTQTNWLGILGEISLYVCDGIFIEKISAVSDMETNSAMLGIVVYSDREEDTEQEICVRSQVLKCKREIPELKEKAYRDPQMPTTEEMLADVAEFLPSGAGDFTHTVTLKKGQNVLQVQFGLGESPYFWSDEDPYLYRIRVTLTDADEETIYFGFHELRCEEMHFWINGSKTFLRGKHDGMVFPMTGFAPMNLYGWLYVMRKARELGINHYRFHTCTPPDAAFLAADLLGIFMEPEVPFWGTLLGEEDEGYAEAAEAQEFLQEEGFRMLSCFASHPSYCMMSMGNELWGNPQAIDRIVAGYKEKYPHILFTQSSNGFQWAPNIQPHDDFFCGVRFAVDRQLRGSYAACDKPFGHVQNGRPGTRYCYDEAIFPGSGESGGETGAESKDGYVEIQYGTGVKRVKLSDTDAGLIPQIPIITHEIGQYATFPNLREEEKYTGVLKARYLDVVRERLREKNLLAFADDYVQASGALAAACYKEELESVFRTEALAGFQVLDIQDFPGQEIALVGVLDALMEDKGMLSAEEYRRFCSDAVLLARFDRYVISDAEDRIFRFDVDLAYYRSGNLTGKSMELRFDRWDLQTGVHTLIYADTRALPTEIARGLNRLASYEIEVPQDQDQSAYRLTLSIAGTDIINDYTLWSYLAQRRQAEALFAENEELVAESLEEALEKTKAGGSVLLLLPEAENAGSIEGTYSTDFWCYPMFRGISEWMEKDLPIGTMGLLIRSDHPALSGFLTQRHTTPQWYDLVMESRASVLDDTEIVPIVQTIDNFERNHRLGLLYEVYLEDRDASLFISTIPLKRLALAGSAPAYFLGKSLIDYVRGNARERAYAMTSEALKGMLL